MQIAIGLYPGFTALDAIGPYQVLTQVPGVEVVLCAAETGRLSDDNGLLHFDIEHTFDEVASPDLLLVPGGFITRRLARDRAPDRRLDRRAPTRTPRTPPRSAPARCCWGRPASSTASRRPPTGPPTTTWPLRRHAHRAAGRPAGEDLDRGRGVGRHRPGAHARRPRCGAPRCRRPSSSASSTTPSRRSTAAPPARPTPTSSPSSRPSAPRRKPPSAPS